VPMFAPCLLASSDLVLRGWPVRCRIKGHRPGAAPPRPADAPPGQWSGPSRRAPGARVESPIPMPSRNVRPAGNRHSCGDTPLMPRARPAGYLPGMRGAAAWLSQAVVPTAVSARSGKSAGTSAWKRCPERQGAPMSRLAGRACQLMASGVGAPGRGRKAPRRRRQHAADIGVPGKPGRGQPQPGRMPDRRGITAPGTVAPARGLCAPGTAHGRVWRGTGRKDQADEERPQTQVPGLVADYRHRRGSQFVGGVTSHASPNSGPGGVPGTGQPERAIWRSLYRRLLGSIDAGNGAERRIFTAYGNAMAGSRPVSRPCSRRCTCATTRTPGPVTRRAPRRHFPASAWTSSWSCPVASGWSSNAMASSTTQMTPATRAHGGTPR
jgi:hypothetical protein